MSVSSGACFSIREQSAGVRVSATSPESTTEMTIVAANCWYMLPVMPPMNATGTNTEQSTSTMAISAPAIWRMARFVAALGGRCSCAIIRSTFSMTTMASSTTIPIARTIPNSVSVFTENPSAFNPRKVPMMLTGTARTGMSVARQLCRNTNTTSVTSSIASSSVFATSIIDSVMKGVVSNGELHVTPLGNDFASSFIRVSTAVRTSRLLASGRL